MYDCRMIGGKNLQPLAQTGVSEHKFLHKSKHGGAAGIFIGSTAGCQRFPCACTAHGALPLEQRHLQTGTLEIISGYKSIDSSPDHDNFLARHNVFLPA